MKLFYFFAILGLLALFVIEPSSEIQLRVNSSTGLIIFLMILAVYGIDKKIERAVKEISEPEFDINAANRKDWFDLGRTFLLILGILFIGTVIQGSYRCLSEGGVFSIDCVSDGIHQQLGDDLNIENR